jgi:hypothetical protein
MADELNLNLGSTGPTGDDVSAKSHAVECMAETWRLVEDLMGGTAAMRKACKRHLPQWPAEDFFSYEFRRKTATLFPAYRRTVSVLVGKPFSKPPTPSEDMPERIKAWLEDVDREGRNLAAFAADLCTDALAYGLCGILVDAPPGEGLRTVADEQAAGIRPYFVHVTHDMILGWRTERRGGATVLSQLRLMESVEEPDGAFGTKCVQQVRVLEPRKWATYRKVKGATGAESWDLHERGTTSIDVIPFAPVYGYRKGFLQGVPPMLDLAYLNVEHWQSKSDQQNILHTARVPILFAKDMEGDDLHVGAGAIVKATSATADLRFVEHSGSSIEAGRQSLLDLEDQMRQIGAELLVIKPGNTTEVQTRQDNEPAMCDLQRIMQALEDALDLALSFMARFVGEPTGGTVAIYSDFGVATLQEASAQLLASMQEAGSLSHATLLNELKRRGVLSADVDVGKEVAASADERQAAQDAAAAREQAMLQAAQDHAAFHQHDSQHDQAIPFGGQ